MKIAIISQSSPFVNETSALSGHTLDTYAGKLSTYTLQKSYQVIFTISYYLI